MFAAVFDGDASAVAGWLRGHGIRRACHLSALFRDTELNDGTVLKKLAKELCIMSPSELESAEQDLKRLIDLARTQVAIEREDYARSPTWSLTAQIERRQQQAQAERDDILFLSRLDLTTTTSRRPAPTRPRFPTTRAREAARDAPHARELAEKASKEKWIGELVEIMRGIEAPSLTALGESHDPLALFRLTFQGKRASTLRARVREWSRFSTWLIRVKGRSWPRHVTDVLDYAMERLEEPCTKASLRGFWASLGFMERHAGIANALNDQEMVKVGVQAMISEARTRMDGTGTKRALPPPVQILAGLEDAVMQEDRPKLDRLLAWWMCASTWCSFRFDDHRGLPPHNIVITASGYQFTLDRSKTTGPDKAVTLRHGIISMESYVRQPKWLEVGFNLWREQAPFVRDFFLCRPNGEGGCVPIEMQYVEYSGLMRYLLTTIPLGSDDTLLSDEATMCISPHSFRAFLPSALKALGAPEGERAWMSAWQAKGSDLYVRTGRARAVQMQTKLATIIRNQLAKGDPIGERDILDQFEGRLAARGVEDAETRSILGALTSFRDPDEQTPTWTNGGTADETSIDKNTIATSTSSDQGQERPTASNQSKAFKARKTGATESPQTAGKEPEQITTQAIGDNEAGYVIAISTKTRLRTLHRLGACYRRPGVHYGQYLLKGHVMPAAKEYDSFCKTCWKGDSEPMAGRTGSSDGTSCETTDESSSTGAE